VGQLGLPADWLHAEAEHKTRERPLVTRPR
jgi:hypothetical protein